jgi:hypothetical protein
MLLGITANIVALSALISLINLMDQFIVGFNYEACLGSPL